jgi:hypothetical protein
VGHRPARAERFHELQERVVAVKVCKSHGQLTNNFGAGNVEAQPSFEVLKRPLGVRYGDRDVIQT